MEHTHQDVLVPWTARTISLMSAQSMTPRLRARDVMTTIIASRGRFLLTVQERLRPRQVCTPSPPKKYRQDMEHLLEVATQAHAPCWHERTTGHRKLTCLSCTA